MGLNGVDNGQIWFNNVAVSRDAMLDRWMWGGGWVGEQASWHSLQLAGLSHTL
jgi:alkylation response protein AidB-like acyl-CoA dehydrogenase